MTDGVRVVVRRLRERRAEIEESIFARVRDAVNDPVGYSDAEYVAGLRTAVAAAVDYGLAGIGEDGGRSTVAVPREAIAQAKLAARSGVSLDTVLQRYIVGHALLWDYVMEEADRAGPPGGALREMSRAQSMLLERMTAAVAREYGRERERVGHSREQRLAETVRALLADERSTELGDAGGAALDRELGGYELQAEHLGVIARGTGATDALRELAGMLDRQLLSVVQGEATVWAWLGGQRPLRMTDLRRVLGGREGRAGEHAGPKHGALGTTNTGKRAAQTAVSLAVGEPARGLAGWRNTHLQAQAALLVALRRPAVLMCYADVALLAAALKDETLARALLDMYVAPLGDAANGRSVLGATLRAYLTAERNASSAAARLKVARSTVEKRLRIAEERLGRPLHPCPVELEVALQLDALGLPDGKDISALDSSSA
jgi:hypothetical protein